jgi:hypothetical protein
MVLTNNEIDTTQKCRQINDNFDYHADVAVPCRMWGTSPNEAHPGLHSKPLDAAIGQVLASHCRGGCRGRRFWSKTQNTNKLPYLAS